MTTRRGGLLGYRPVVWPVRLLICGDRHWSDRSLIVDCLVAIGPSRIACVIHGDAPGADTLAGVAAKRLGIDVVAVPADWDTYPNGAGPIRNQKMLTDEQPTAALAFHDRIEESRGTADMVRRLERARVTHSIISHRTRTIAWL